MWFVAGIGVAGVYFRRFYPVEVHARMTFVSRRIGLMFRLPSSFRHPAAELILKLSVSFSFLSVANVCRTILKTNMGEGEGQGGWEGCHRHLEFFEFSSK